MVMPIFPALLWMSGLGMTSSTGWLSEAMIAGGVPAAADSPFQLVHFVVFEAAFGDGRNVRQIGGSRQPGASDCHQLPVGKKTVQGGKIRRRHRRRRG